MSEPKKERPVVPEGESKYVKTRQMKANEKGFIGYETEWESVSVSGKQLRKVSRSS